ncbi:hypothetical protein BGZ70_006002 [Mortierella alpina]|uniref:Uncharacterized protein n=1 Tax=Mortierella alpina TaxID=64518 RepID=A0A9P6M3A8_MORAP|nr:hypothetical protein BGZ70_006002 [Mortierella alpina]
MSDLDFEALEFMSKPLVTLLDYNPHLTRLVVTYEIFEIDGVSAAVSKLWHLQHLDVRSCLQEHATMKNPCLFFQSCLALPQLTELTFHRDMEMYWDHGDEITVVSRLKAIINEATIARFSHNPSAKKIKLLRLPANLSGIRNPLPLLLLKSSLLDLETCEIPWFREDATIQEIEYVVRAHCPNLKHLECSQLFETNQDGQAAQAFIRGCTGIQSFTSAYFVDSPDDTPRYILSELITHHHTTLEVLELTDPVQVFSHDLQEILSRCRQLRRFWVIGGDDNDSMPGIAFRDISRGDWVCTELRQLGVILNRCRRERDASGPLGEEEHQDDPHVWLTASATKRAYQQIGQLKKLEVLAIDIDRTSGTKAKELDYMLDLTLGQGWLGELAGLKNLRSLMLRADFWSGMGQEDVKFMHEHWPLLDEIIISSDDQELHTKKHWQWLLEKRPYLHFKAMQ